MGTLMIVMMIFLFAVMVWAGCRLHTILRQRMLPAIPQARARG